MLKKLIANLHNSHFFGLIFHTLDYCLYKELEDCTSVLDIGCGPSSPLRNIPHIKYSVGIEAHKSYIDISKSAGIHTKYINANVLDQHFDKASFDAVILIDVLEHLTEKDGLAVLKKVEAWAKKKVIVTTPNGFISQGELDKNPYQRHLSGWESWKLEKLGFSCRGLAGPKFLRKAKEDDDSMDDNLLISIKYSPQIVWFVIATIAQMFTYYIPSVSFGLFCVKKSQK